MNNVYKKHIAYILINNIIFLKLLKISKHKFFLILDTYETHYY